MNITQQIEARAEEFRVKLGLRDWQEQRTIAQSNYFERKRSNLASQADGPERQSGRTTRDILLALAACAVTGIRRVRIDADHLGGRHLAGRFADLADKLDMPVELFSRDIRLNSPHVTYQDHHDAW